MSCARSSGAAAAVARRHNRQKGGAASSPMYESPMAPPPLRPPGGHRTLEARASAAIRKALKEATVLKRRATFGWRHLRAGVLVFQSSGSRRTFAVGKKLGEGGYSTIWRVHEWQPDGSERQFAVKRVILNQDPEQVALVEREIGVMRSLPPHPNVVELIGTCRRQVGSQGRDEVFLLLELCRGGSLGELLMARAEANSPLSAGEVAKAFHDMALSLAHLHAQSPPLAHRDVKPENFILSDLDGRWRLCDFGSATTASFRYTDGTSAYDVADEEDKVHRFSTPQYRAPEQCDVRRGEIIGVGVDVWALGVSLYKLLFLRDLCGTPGEERLASLNFDPAKRLEASALPRMPPDSAASSAALVGLLRLCLVPSAAKRPPIGSVLQWLRAHASRIDSSLPDGRRASYADRESASHTAGMLTISSLHAVGLYPKGVSGSGVKAYLLLTCGGARRLTKVAPKGNEAAWSDKLAVATHGLQTFELTVWAFHKHSAHDFLGAAVLSLSNLVPDPTKPLSVPERVAALQKRSHKSHVSGELSFTFAWEPFAAPATAAARPSPMGGQREPSSGRSSPPQLISLGDTESTAAASSGAAASGTAGSFWSTAAASGTAFASSGANDADCHRAASFSSLGVAPGAATPPAPAASPPRVSAAASGAGSFWTADFSDLTSVFGEAAPASSTSSCAPAGPSTDGAGVLATSSPPSARGGAAVGSFWATDAAASNAWSDLTPPPPGPPPSTAPAPLVFTPSATEFESMSCMSAPWERASGAGGVGGGANGTAATAADPGSFWATFDASPMAGSTLAPPTRAPLVAPRPAQPNATLIDFGSSSTAGPWSDLMQLDGGGGGGTAVAGSSAYASATAKPKGSSSASGGEQASDPHGINALFDLS